MSPTCKIVAYFSPFYFILFYFLSYKFNFDILLFRGTIELELGIYLKYSEREKSSGIPNWLITSTCGTPTTPVGLFNPSPFMGPTLLEALILQFFFFIFNSKT